MLERFDLQGAVAIGDFDADAAERGKCDDFIGGKLALIENAEHFAPDIAGRADHCDFVTHRSLSEGKCFPHAPRRKGSGSASMRETRSTQRYHGAAAFHAVLSGHPRPLASCGQSSSSLERLRRRS